MKVILLQAVPKIGKRGEVKDVNDGYARNFLLPRNLAKVGTPEALKAWELLEKETQIEKTIELSLLKKNLSELSGKMVIITVRANEAGHLFKGINKEEIIAALINQFRIEISPEALILDKPIKNTGEFGIPIEIVGERTVLKITIIPEEK